MKSLFYSWMLFQVLVGIWLFISPFIYGFGNTRLATNNMIWGAIVVILGVVTTFFELYYRERLEGGTVSTLEHAKERI